MSNASGFDPVNPYSAPRDPAALSPWGAPSAPSSLPTFVKVVAMGFFIGAGGVTVFRLAVLALDVAAVCQFVIWSRRQPKNAPMC